MNWQLFSMVWAITSTTVMGIFLVIALLAGFDDIPEIIIAVILGLVTALPIAFVVTKRLYSIGK